MSSSTVEKFLSETTQHAEQFRCDELQSAGELAVGDSVAQGDLLFVRLAEVPKGATRIKNPELQLAPGSTLLTPVRVFCRGKDHLRSKVLSKRHD